VVLLFGGLYNAGARRAEPTPRGGPSSASHGAGQTDHDAMIKVTRVVDCNTIDISPSVEGRWRGRLIGMDTPEVHFGTQPYGPEASAFAKRELDGERVGWS
jgi:endonuclease YncB( thermonuclease family)